MSFVTPVRWIARALSGLLVLFFGFFLLAHFFGDQGRPSRPMVWNDYVILASVISSLVGLLLAWKRELAGASLTLLAIAVCAAVNWKVLVFPGALIPLTAVLYLFAWWMSHSSANRYAAIR